MVYVNGSRYVVACCYEILVKIPAVLLECNIYVHLYMKQLLVTLGLHNYDRCSLVLTVVIYKYLVGAVDW